jgi:hypothetical protein
MSQQQPQFDDARPDGDERWNAIHDTADSAQIHAHIQQQIDAMH